jgi:hypothetical protein
VARRSDSDYVCFLENDVFVDEGWLEKLVEACEDTGSGAAVPLIYERVREAEDVHFDDRLGRIQRVTTPAGPGVALLPADDLKAVQKHGGRRPIELIETHCFLMRRSVFDRLGGFDEQLSTTRTEIDVSLALHHAGVPVVFEPEAGVTFSPPPPIEPEERDFYMFKWSHAQALHDQERIARRWNVVNFPPSLNFAAARRQLASDEAPEIQVERFEAYQERLRQAGRDIAAAVPPGATFLLVDDGQWESNTLGRGRRVLPFLEREGAYWGSPDGDDTALRELERMHGSGAEYIVFGWPAFWWLDTYPGLARHLRDRHACVAATDRVVAFELRQAPAPPAPA